MVSETRRTDDGLDDRQTEDGLYTRVTEFVPVTTVTVQSTIKYNQIGASDLRVRPIFNYEFPVQLYMIVTD
jgi:hypothetical protein